MPHKNDEYVPALIFITGVVFIVGMPLMMTSLLSLYSQNIALFFVTLFLMALLMRSLNTTLKKYKAKRR